MTAYLIRRLLLMIPTLLGITFLVFMLIALAPGGIGAALQAQGGAMEATSRALQRAYLEDRYGLDEPVVVQYFRWLGRISPVKFGPRDQVDSTGDIVRSPKALKAPPLFGQWYGPGTDHPAPAGAEPLAADPLVIPEDDAGKVALFRQQSSRYARARGEFVAARDALEAALRDYAAAREIEGAVKRGNELVLSKFRAETFDAQSPEGQRVVAAGLEAVRRLDMANAERTRMKQVFDSKPFKDAGVWVIPGAVSLAAPDFGRSFSKSLPVTDLIGRALPVTLMLNIMAFPIIYLIAVPSGVLAATKRRTWIDATLGAMYVALWSIPTVWAGTLALGYIANKKHLGWFPVNGLNSADAADFTFLPSFDAATGLWQRGLVLDTLWHVALPVMCIVYTGFAVLSKQTRAAMLENFSADYVRTAKAKGVSLTDIVFRHVFRNSLLPLITMFAQIFPAMLAGSVVVERIFGIPGMGSLIIDSISQRDREVLLANVMMLATVNLLALLLADILYALADPRVSYE